jgi:hypothetical protein
MRPAGAFHQEPAQSALARGVDDFFTCTFVRLYQNVAIIVFNIVTLVNMVIKLKPCVTGRYA